MINRTERKKRKIENYFENLNMTVIVNNIICGKSQEHSILCS
jgi:hypothetical protein